MSTAAARSAPIGGSCDPAFSAPRDAFESLFGDLDERGASLCVRVGGRQVVDLWGGFVDAERSLPWQRDTLVNAYSVGKGILAVLALRCIEEGELRLERPVASYWPELCAEDKQRLSVRELLAHRAGLPAVRARLPAEALYDWDRMCAALASQRPYWEPGSAHGYHVNTQGFLVGELLRRATGVPVAALLRQRVTGPAAADFHFGLPASEHHRVATVLAPQAQLHGPEDWARVFPATGDAEHDEMIWHSYFNPVAISGLGAVNTGPWREAVLPSTNGHATARGVAAVYAAYVAEVDAALRQEAASPHSDGVDRVLGRASRFGLGFQIAHPGRTLGPGASSYGHFGYGGSLGMVDPDADVVFAYLTCRPGERWKTPRTERLLDALYASL